MAERFLAGEHNHALVLNHETGELAGMLTAFDILKTKNWELLQEMSRTQPPFRHVTAAVWIAPPRVSENTEQEQEMAD